MFQRISQKFRDMATIKALCEQAEAHARRSGHAEPGAEHFVLAALDLPDGSARRAFAQVGADSADFANAILRQQAEALQAVGIRADPGLLAPDEAAPSQPIPRLYASQPSARRLFELLTGVQQQHPRDPLSGAHVLLAVTQMQQGVVARSLRAMGIEADALAAAAAAQLRAAAEI
jgi:ATP-dependent Clp protease ATP-binding subunit ClpA